MEKTVDYFIVCNVITAKKNLGCLLIKEALISSSISAFSDLWKFSNLSPSTIWTTKETQIPIKRIKKTEVGDLNFNLDKAPCHRRERKCLSPILLSADLAKYPYHLCWKLVFTRSMPKRN